MRRCAGLLLFCALLACCVAQAPARAVRAEPLPQAPTPAAPDLETAFRVALAAYAQRFAPGARFRLGPLQQAGGWACLLVQPLDAAGRPLEEPVLALLAHQDPALGWRVAAPRLTPAAEYNALLASFPASLLSEGARAYLGQPVVAAASQANFSGHHFPWGLGKMAYLTQIDQPYHIGQVDFDIEGIRLAGDVYASKPGQVVFVKQSSDCHQCPPSAGQTYNMVVIQHGPGEFTWYVHLAYHSATVAVGDWVGYGTRIGVEGDTGYATGVHLHYMASTDHTAWTDPEDPDVAPWPPSGTIVPVDFLESPWSSLVEWHTYTSQNAPPPPLPVRSYLPLVQSAPDQP